MRNAFCTKVESLFTANPYDIERLSDAVLYAYDCKQSKRTFFTASAEFCEKSLKITNNEQHEIVHICVDGGLIQYGLEDYIGDGKKHGRCDCIIFDNNRLLLVEFKMDVEPLTKDKTLWGNFSHAMNQIKDFYLYLKDRFLQSGDDLHLFYENTNIIPIICMKYTPNIHPKRNAQRNNEKERFRMATNLKIQSFCEYKL